MGRLLKVFIHSEISLRVYRVQRMHVLLIIIVCTYHIINDTF